jgi:hypothetical protein
MSDRRVFRWATTGARILAATLVSVFAVVAVVTAISLPWPTLMRQPVSVSATPAPAPTVVVCDGALVAVGRDSGNASQISAVADQTVTSGVRAGGTGADETTLNSPTLTGGSGPMAITAPPSGRKRTDVAASGSASVTAADISGFAASACGPPLLESWLVGGSGVTGAADIVVLSNPGAVPATVQLTTYTAKGAQTPPGSQIIVPPGTQQFVPLAGLVLGETAPVIRVSAVGAPVHASLQASITRTLTPGGIDQVGAMTAPTRTQTIAGVTVTAKPGAAGASDASTILRLLAPSATAAATVTVRPVGGSTAVKQPQQVPLKAGQPTEIGLGGLPVGTYDVEVSADEPVVAAVWQTTGFGQGDDFAWYTASPLVSVPSLFATPDGPAPLLTLVNAAAKPAVVSVNSQDGSFRLQVTVPARGSTTVRLAPSAMYDLVPDASGIRAALSLSADGELAGFPVWPADVAAAAIIVYP